MILDLCKAFLVGGMICAIGQLLIDKTKLTPAKILVCFVCAGIVLTAVGLYEPIVKWANAGATVPLTGFGYALAKGTQKAVAEKGWLGIIWGPLASGAVGITATIIAGLLVSLFTRSKAKDA